MKNRYTRALNDVHLTEEFREKLGGALRTPPLLNRPYQEKPTAVKTAWHRRKPYIAAGTATAAVTLTILVLLTTFTRSHLPPLPIDSSVAPTTAGDDFFHGRSLLRRDIGAEHDQYQAEREYCRRAYHHLQSERRHDRSHNQAKSAAPAMYSRCDTA